MKSSNIIFQVTKHYMKRNRRRTVITFIGIVFMVMLMTCVFAGKKTALAYLEQVAAKDKGSWHMTAYDLTPDEADRIAALEDVSYIGRSAQLGQLEFAQSADPGYKPFLDLRAYSPESLEFFCIRMKEGRFPENANEVVISSSAVEDGSAIQIGDHISGAFFRRTITGINQKIKESVFPSDNLVLQYGETVEVSGSFMSYSENPNYTEERVPTGADADMTVVGIMETPSFEKKAGASYIAICGMDGLSPSRVNAAIRFAENRSVDPFELEEQIREITGRDTKTETNDMLLAFSANSSYSGLNEMTVMIEMFFTVLIMAASMILIYNVFNMSFAERAKYLGMLASVGATKNQKRQSIYYECFVLLIPALPLGILAGLGLVYGAMHLLKPGLDTIISLTSFGLTEGVPVKLFADWKAIGLVLLMSAATVMISVLIPAYQIGKIQPVESVRGNAEIAKKKNFATKTRLLAKGKPERLLAENAVSRSGHLTKGIIRSIAVFSVLTMVTLYGAQAVIHVMTAMSEDEGWDYIPETFDYYAMAEDEADYQNLSALEKSSIVSAYKEITDGFTWLSSCYVSDAYIDAIREIYLQFDNHTEADWNTYYEKHGDIQQIHVLAVDDADFQALAKSGDADMQIAGDSNIPAVLVYNEAHPSTEYFRFGSENHEYRYFTVDDVINVPKGGTIEVKGDNILEPGTPMTVAGFVTPESAKNLFHISTAVPYLFLNRSAYELLSENLEFYSPCIFFAADPENKESVAAQLKEIKAESEARGNNVAVGEFSQRNIVLSIRQAVTAIVRVLAYSFTVLVSMICLLNLFNSIRGRAAERTQETAVLRSVGMTDHQLRHMHDLEILMLTGRGLLIAGVICAVLFTVLRRFINQQLGRISLPVPWLLMAGIVACICATAFVITRLCCGKADRSDIIAEIRRGTV
ncbi:MAG: FtsX-like permease family protein [Oscillospiraceae bacterium]|nr:FtsX-like permease family protein [Oscillospiraceae bacterium]